MEKNREKLNKKIIDYNQLCIKINENKIKLIDKWKLNDIDWKSNWSLSSYNSYLIALLSINLHNTNSNNNNNDYSNIFNHFHGLNLLLTNNFTGLNRNGYICIKVDLVIEQWIEVRLILIPKYTIFLLFFK